MSAKRENDGKQHEQWSWWLQRKRQTRVPA
jgi:hypothetical protein